MPDFKSVRLVLQLARKSDAVEEYTEELCVDFGLQNVIHSWNNIWKCNEILKGHTFTIGMGLRAYICMAFTCYL